MTLTHLMQPGKIGSMRVPNRILMAPMEKNYATRDGQVTQRYVDYLVKRAHGGAALLRGEATYVHRAGKGRMYQLGAHDDRVIPGLAHLAGCVHGAGGRVSLELCHSGRQTNSQNSALRPVAPSSITCDVSGGYSPRELSGSEILQLIKCFGAAAARCRAAGLDAVEIHGASGYLVNGFLSPLTNLRTDEYGGTLERRMRFALQVVAEIRDRVGGDFPVLFRLCAHEYIDGGLTLEESVPVAVELERAGVDLIDVTGGIYETVMRTIPPMEAEPGELADLAHAVKKAVGIPVGVTGKMGSDLKLADRLVGEERVDFVSIGRGLHADPDLVRKIATGTERQVRRCISCSECSSFLGRHAPAFCAINPETGREAEFRIRPIRGVRRSVLIVGGGPAGLEAARVSRLRGHDVVLYDRGDAPGGQIRAAARVPGRNAIGWSVEDASQALVDLDVPVVLGVEVGMEFIEEKEPEVVVVATGAEPCRWEVPGGDGRNVFTALEVLDEDAGMTDGRRELLGAMRKDAGGIRAIVVGANWIACNAADHLAELGASVTIVGIETALAGDMGARPGHVLRERLLSRPRVNLRLNSTVETIADTGVEIWEFDSSSARSLHADLVVMAMGMESRRTLLETIHGSDSVREVYAVGDCVSPRGLPDAVYEGASVALHI